MTSTAPPSYREVLDEDIRNARNGLREAFHRPDVVAQLEQDFEIIDGQMVLKKKRYPYKIIKRSEKKKKAEYEALKKRVEDREKGGIDMKKWDKSLKKSLKHTYNTNPKARKAMNELSAMLDGMFTF